MAARSFVPGQRWISDTESELGLGIVDGCDGRRVVLRFPAAQERRTYAVDNAPLTRVLYPVGETVKTVDGQPLTITHRRERASLVCYHGLGADGEARVVHEAQLDSFAHFTRPQDRLLAGQLDPSSHFELRVETLAHRHRHGQSPANGLLGARIALLPHQLFIASEVGERHAPRVLLADEVGLGKTIEAGLIVHQQILTGRASRALFLVPETLVHQWLVEMLRRFNLRVSVLDDERCAALEGSAGENPFDSAQLVLCPLSTLSGNPRRLQQALATGWDLLVVDEAHHLEWTEHAASPAYHAVEALARQVPGLLLLTATPEQLGAGGHFARLRLLDPQRYPDPERFEQEESGYQAISALVQQLMAGALLAGSSQALAVVDGVAAYLGNATAGALRASLDGDQAEVEVAAVIRALLDRHGTGRVLFRNTRSAVGGFPPRRLVTHPLPHPAQDPTDARAASLFRHLDPAQALGEGWTRHDARVAWLADFLRQGCSQRTLVICARADTARSLEEYLRLRMGLRTAVFHEAMSLIARDRAAAYFAQPDPDGAQVLICSEIGSEGRNFQHAHQLVLFDLPLDPELLEQRIGRVDRIGQRHEVVIHVPHHPGGADHALLRWYHEGLDAFEHPCAIGERMRERFAGRLQKCLTDPGPASLLDALIMDTRAEAHRIRRALELGRDRLLELGSCDPDRAADVVQAVVDASRSRQLAAYMDGVFDLFGVEHQADTAHTIVIHPGNQMLCHDFPGLPEDGTTATFQRAEALAREDLEFLTWEHPMVAGAMSMILDGEIGNATLCTLNGLPLPAGTLVLEAIFDVTCPGPRTLHLSRYLPGEFVRYVVAGTGQDLTRAFPPSAINRRAGAIAEETAREVLRHAWPRIEDLVGHAQRLALGDQDEIVAAVRQVAARRNGSELERLRALAAVNPNIRAEEIAHLEARGEEIQRHLRGAALHLDALRIGIVT